MEGAALSVDRAVENMSLQHARMHLYPVM